MQPLMMGDCPLVRLGVFPVAASSAPESAEWWMTTWFRWFPTPVVDNTLACLASFIHDLSRVSSAVRSSARSVVRFASVFALSTPKSYRPPSVFLPRLLRLRVLVRQTGGGGGGCAVSGSPSGAPALCRCPSLALRLRHP